jgi:hypothetical protein
MRNGEDLETVGSSRGGGRVCVAGPVSAAFVFFPKYFIKIYKDRL